VGVAGKVVGGGRAATPKGWLPVGSHPYAFF
jgi:hypothetical protein